MKLHRSRSIQSILEHRVRSGFPNSTVRQCKNDKSILNHYTKIPEVGPQINRQNLLYSFGWIISLLFDQFPYLADFFSSKIILNTEAKYRYMIDAVTKSKYLFLVR